MTTTTSPAPTGQANAVHRDALRSAYLFVWEHAPTDRVAVVDGCRFNDRFAREILGVLATAGLITVENHEGEDLLYYNEAKFTESGLADDEEPAQELIDTWLADNGYEPTQAPTAKATTATRPRTAKPKGSGECVCGCGTPTGKLFAPGHDARMAGTVARQIAGRSGLTSEMVEGMLSILPTEKLRRKALDHANRLVAKESRRLEAKAEGIIQGDDDDPEQAAALAENQRLDADAGFTYGVVKIGRNRFAARRDADGVIMRGSKALPNEVVPLPSYLEVDYTGTVEGNAAKSFKALEIQP